MKGDLSFNCLIGGWGFRIVNMEVCVCGGGGGASLTDSVFLPSSNTSQLDVGVRFGVLGLPPCRRVEVEVGL